MAALFIFDELQRRDLRKQRVFRDRRNPLDYLTDGEIRERYRLPRLYLLQLVECAIWKNQHREANLSHPPFK